MGVDTSELREPLGQLIESSEIGPTLPNFPAHVKLILAVGDSAAWTSKNPLKAVS